MIVTAGARTTAAIGGVLIFDIALMVWPACIAFLTLIGALQ